MIPVLSNPPLCRLRDLQDGTYDLADVALMIDGLMVKADNEAIAQEMRDRRAKSR
jgi:uncharacterized protein DUF6889